MITGQELLSTQISTSSGRVIPLRVVMPEHTISNAQEIARQQKQWSTIAQDYERRFHRGEIPWPVAYRARFAAEALWLAGSMVSARTPDAWVALSNSDIIGVMIHTHRDSREIHIDYVAIAPQFQPGSPNGDKPKGIGTAMVEALVQEANRENIPKLTLQALDAPAFKFWQSHGFRDSRPHQPMYAHPSQVYCYIADNPDAGDVALAGDLSKIPGARALAVKTKELPVAGPTEYKVMPGLTRLGKRGIALMGRRDLPPIIDKRWAKQGKELPWILAHEIGHQVIYDLETVAKRHRPDLFTRGDTETNVARWMIQEGVDPRQIRFRDPTLAIYATDFANDLRAGRPVDHRIAGEFVAEVVAYYITTYQETGVYRLPSGIEDAIKQAIEMPPYERRTR